ncbi:MAG: Gfo/Idh/MocA family oxidoreductase [Clostridia bacterium]|nr:Gfo/Idh/MocA family oxidoreductase [Clostridia bacterium]
MMNIGIIGAGRIGKVHAESVMRFVKNATVKAIADPFMNEQTIAWAKEMGINEIYTDYHKILEDKDIEIVLICSSTDTHSKISLEAIEAGKHIFCEKPIDHDVNKIKEVMEALKNSSVKYQVGFNRRFDHNFMAAREAVKAGKIGELNILKICSRDPGAPPVSYIKVSGGIFLDMTIHDFDMVRFMSGDEVEEVYVPLWVSSPFTT